MKVTYTDDAVADFVDIGEYIARDDPAAARRFLTDLRSFILRVATTPRAYRLREEWGGNVRAARFGNYLVVFEMEADELLVLRIANGRRHIARLLAGRLS